MCWPKNGPTRFRTHKRKLGYGVCGLRLMAASPLSGGSRKCNVMWSVVLPCRAQRVTAGRPVKGARHAAGIRIGKKMGKGGLGGGDGGRGLVGVRD